jgi:hypothetical protein
MGDHPLDLLGADRLAEILLQQGQRLLAFGRGSVAQQRPGDR